MYDAMMAETISFAGHGGDLIEGYLARPLGPGPYGSVVVIHHMPGYDAETKEITRTFAVHGYLALCPNLYYREAPGASPDDRAACPTSGWSATSGERPPTCGRCRSPTGRRA
jgi:carboxymethylenebutenolidase